jgi:hypothetical protein
MIKRKGAATGRPFLLCGDLFGSYSAAMRTSGAAARTSAST